MCTIDVCVGEGVRVTKAQIDMGLCGEMEDCINIVSLQAIHDLGGICNVAMVEREISLVVEDSSVVQGGAVVELVKGYDIVRIWVGQG